MRGCGQLGGLLGSHPGGDDSRGGQQCKGREDSKVCLESTCVGVLRLS